MHAPQRCRIGTKRSAEESDINAQRIAALQSVVTRLGETQEFSEDDGSESEDGSVGDIDLGQEEVAGTTLRRDEVKTLLDVGETKRVERFVVHTGNVLVDKFEPWYFGVALGVLFKYCIGMPDPPQFTKKPWFRRPTAEPRVELQQWVQIMARRVGAQFHRDLTFGFATWI